MAGTITAASGVIANAAITNAKIADATIQSAKIASLDAGKVTTGTLQSATGNSWISLSNGQFSFGNGALAWNGSSLTAQGVFAAVSGTYTAKLDAGSLRLLNSGVELGYVSIQTAGPTGPWLSAAAGASTINLAKVVGSSLYTAYKINWGSTSGTSATHNFWGQMITQAIAADGVITCWRVEPHLGQQRPVRYNNQTLAGSACAGGVFQQADNRVEHLLGCGGDDSDNSVLDNRVVWENLPFCAESVWPVHT